MCCSQLVLERFRESGIVGIDSFADFGQIVEGIETRDSSFFYSYVVKRKENVAKRIGIGIVSENFPKNRDLRFLDFRETFQHYYSCKIVLWALEIGQT